MPRSTPRLLYCVHCSHRYGKVRHKRSNKVTVRQKGRIENASLQRSRPRVHCVRCSHHHVERSSLHGDHARAGFGDCLRAAVHASRQHAGVAEAQQRASGAEPRGLGLNGGGDVRLAGHVDRRACSGGCGGGVVVVVVVIVVIVVVSVVSVVVIVVVVVVVNDGRGGSMMVRDECGG